MGGMVAVLGYHKVGPEADEGRFLNVQPEDLRSQIRFLQRRRFRFVQAQDLAVHPGGRVACLTFDDAYLSFLTFGLEVLREEGVTASTYVVTGKVGGASDWDGERARPLGGWDLLAKAAEAGVEIGNHTVSHRRLGELSAVEGRADLAGAQAALAERGYRSGSVCYPYGSFGEWTGEAVLDMGYRVGLSVARGLVGAEDDRLFLKRVMVSFSDRVPGLWYKLMVKPRLFGSRT